MKCAMQHPVLIFIISGKRKSGKDYFSNLLTTKFGSEICAVLHLSGPLKKRYSEIHNLDYEKLLGTSSYKEKYREDMIKWGENERTKDPSVFCRLSTETEEAVSKSFWIITDARRPSDLEYFNAAFPGRVVLIRIESTTDNRAKRGWKFAENVDNARSECALDEGIQWDYIVDNNGICCENCPENVIEKLYSIFRSRNSLMEISSK